MEDRGSGAVVVGTIGLDPGSPNKTLKLPVDDHPLPSTQFRAPVLPLPKGVVFSFIGTHNIQHIRDLHSVIFPVRYNDQFFRDLCFVHLKELSRIAFFNHTPIGAICCRREPLLPPKSSGLSRAAPTTVPLPLATQHPKSSGLKQIPPVPSPSDPSRIYIMTLGVLAPYRRLHVGSHLLDHIIQFAQETPHIYQLCLHVQTTNTAALAFYERKGFEKRQLLSGYYARNKGVEPPDAWFLVRIIRLGG
ncbi:acyl-CoA N-acyltransferase [Phlyctochytrium arcticum]|nr:acyl-CoA N-acyltransferase [Phlyctochytrium arcticum]